MQSSQLCLCTLEKKHEKEVAFLLEEYATTEALSKFMKLTDEDKNILNQTYSMLAFNGLSFGIFDKEINKLAGIIINSVPEHYKMFGGFDEVEKKMSVQSKALLRFELYMEEGTVDFLGSDNYMTAEIGFILPKYRGHGLMKLTWDRIISIAQEIKVDAILTAFNSHTLANNFITRYNGFLPLKRVYYEDYIDPIMNKMIFAGLPSSTYLYATQFIVFSKKSKL